MIKKLAFFVASFALPIGALAASITNIEFQNGDVTYQGTGGSSVSAKVRVVVPANQVVEKLQIDVLGDSLASECVDVGGDKGLEEGTHFVNVSLKLPPNTGSYMPEFQGSGIYGAFRAVDCTSNVTASAVSFGNALKVVSNAVNSGNTNTGSSNDAPPAWLSALLAQIQANMAALLAALKPVTPPTPPTPTLCVQLLTAQASGTSALQSFLMTNGQANMFHAAGVYAPTNFFGPITTSALNAFKMQNNCY